ncbi:uncharacterized protein, partial [Mycetomoellerius zeteki]|uniref:uncharacterized protein n=1 Tax=Mycetomoellerius zeteki TaxID=64791 RepID=UPI00084E67D7
MLNLSKKFANDPAYATAYYEFLSEYERLDHMTRVPDGQSEPDLAYYLPHHGIVRESSLSTRLRVVFNGSSRSNTGTSLNDLLHTGTKLQTDRIFWISQDKDVATYQLKTVTYGLACAPFLALRTLTQLIKDDGSKFPLAIPSLTQGRYVDDIFGGADTIPQVHEIVHQLNSLCMAGGFPLQKWTSNHPAILDFILPEKHAHSSIQFDQSSTVHVLGLQWNPSTDTFHYSVTTSIPTIMTKRIILSTIAKVFDPLGLLAPILITAKIFMQELWAIKLGWDDPLPLPISNKWAEFLELLQHIPQLNFPRWINFESGRRLEIHGFCDASQKAICATIYIRSSNQKGEITTSLICSKTKVAPLKKITIPRLELSGAVMLNNLVSRVLQILQFDDLPIYLWTDSAVVYTWINSHPSRWKEFVHNRVCQIHETLPQAIWKFIPSRLCNQ